LLAKEKENQAKLLENMKAQEIESLKL